jgi:hypothetical protein
MASFQIETNYEENLQRAIKASEESKREEDERREEARKKREEFLKAKRDEEERDRKSVENAIRESIKSEKRRIEQAEQEKRRIEQAEQEKRRMEQEEQERNKVNSYYCGKCSGWDTCEDCSNAYDRMMGAKKHNNLNSEEDIAGIVGIEVDCRNFCFKNDTGFSYDEDINKVMIIMIISSIANLIKNLKCDNSNRLKIPGDGFCSFWALILLLLMHGEKFPSFDIDKLIQGVNNIKYLIEQHNMTLTEAISSIMNIPVHVETLDLSDTIKQLHDMYKKNAPGYFWKNEYNSFISILKWNMNEPLEYTYILHSGAHFDLVYNDTEELFMNFDMERLKALQYLLEIYNKYHNDKSIFTDEDYALFEQLGHRIKRNDIVEK